MATTFKLPKVTEYVKNVGKSVAFVSIDTIKGSSPGIKDFIETNDDIFKEVYSSVRNYRQSVKSAGKSIKQSNEYQAIEAGVKYMIEDAKTGKFYNKDRISDIGESALGFDDFDDDTDYYSSDDSPSATDNLSNAIETAATSQTTIVAQSTDMMIRSTKASTKLIMAHMDRTNAALTSSIGSVYSAISATNAFLNGPMMAHLENSKRFYEENLKATNEINGMMREILEMQRNLYKAEGARQNDSKLDQSIRGDGYVDMGGYAKNIKSNISDILDSTGLSMLKMDMGGGNPYMLAAANPFSLILGPIFSKLMSKDLKNALASFDKGATSMFSQFVARMNTAKKNNDEFGFMGILGKLFGIDLDVKDTISTKNYKKDAVPFDGITRQSIIETIPGYLARIEAALTGSGERHYDFQSGSWKSAKQIEKEFDDHKKRAIAGANYYGISEFDQMLSRLEAQGEDGKKKAKSLRKQGMNAFTKIFDMGGDFRPQGMKNEYGEFVDGWKLYGFKSEKDFNMWFKSLSRNTIRGFANENLNARESLSKTIRNEEANGGTARHLFNGAYDMSGVGNGKRNNPSKFIGGGNGLLAFSADKSGRNIFWYLNEILGSINNYRRGKKQKKSNSKSYSTSNNRSHNTSSNNSESNESSDSDPDPDGYDDEFDEFIEEENKRRAEEENKDGRKRLGDWIGKKFGKSKIGQSISKAFNGAEDLLSKPMEFMTKMLNKADEGIFKMMFGEKKFTDEDGNEVDNVFQWIVHEVKTSFKKLNEEIKKIFNPILDRIKDTLKPLWEKHGKPVVDEMKNMARTGWDRVKTGFGNTFGKGFQNIKTEVGRYHDSKDFAKAAAEATGKSQHSIQYAMAKRKMTKDEYYANSHAIRKAAYDAMKKASEGGVASADEATGTASAKDKKDSGVKIVESAYGRYVTKRGFTMISPGEMIIPASFDKREQKKMLALERRDRSRISDAIGLNAEGTVDTDKLKDHLKNIYNENKGNGSKNIASGIMGAGAGALLMGNPLLGALAGAGLSILNNSETFKSAIFGKELEDGTREGGLIPKKVSDFFKKALPDMGDFGIAGGLLGLFTPFGPLGGAAIGAGVGMLKNSEGFKKFIFGDEETGKDGLISKESAEKAKAFLIKAAPKAAIGAVAGAFLGPFGLVGNAALGASAGLISSTDTFHKILFGDPEDSNSTGGLFGAINRGVIDPAKKKIGEILEGFKGYTRKYILDPLKNFWEPFQQSIKNTITHVGDKIKDHLNDMFEKKLGLPIYDFLQEKLFKPVTKVVFGILKAPVAVGKAIVAAPFKALGGIGNSMRMSQIRKGTAYDMSAAERLAWRDQHKGRARFRGLFGKDKMIEQDEMLAGMSEEQLNEIAINSRAGLESMESLQKAKGKAKDAVSQEFSKFFNEKVDGSIRYDKVKYKEVNKILKKIEEKGDVEFARDEINKIKGLTDEEKSKLFNSVSDKIAEVGRTSAAYDSAKDLTKDTDAELSKLLGRKVKNRKDKRQIYRSAEAELKARNKAKKDAEDENEESTPEAKAVKDFELEYKNRTDTIIEILRSTSENLKKILDPTYVGENTSTDNETEKPEDTLNAIEGATTSMKSTTVAITSPLLKAQNEESGEDHEDTKEFMDAKKDAEEDEKDEKTANAAERESASWLEKLHNKFFGDKKDEKKKEGGGLLGRIGSAIGSVFTMLGGPVSTIAKIGLSTVGIAGGVSILGYASEWIKESFWPKLKEILFGSDNDPTSGIIDKIGAKFKTVLFGDENDPDDGLWGKFKNTKIGLFFGKVGEAFGTTVDKIKEKGGIKEYFVQEMMPKIIDKFLIGWGYSMENIVAPLTSLIVKHAPAMLASLGSALIKGITSAIFKKEITRDNEMNVISDTTEFDSRHSSVSSTLGASVSETVKKHYSAASSANVGRVSAPIEWANYFDSNYKSSDETYDHTGKNLNKTSDEIMYTKENGILGLLGAKRSTNQLYYDENGNIALDSYDQMNTVDSVASRVAKSTGSGFLRGIGGSKGIIGGVLSKVSGKGFGSGFMGLGTGAISKGFKLTGKTLNAGNKFGNTINNMMGNSLAIGDFTKSATQEYIDTLVSAGVGSADDITKLVTEKGITGAAKELTKTLKNSPNWGDIRHIVMGGARDTNLAIKDTKNLYGIGAKNSDNVASAVANTADESTSFISKIANKIKTSISKKGAEKAGVTATNASANVIDDAAATATKTATKVTEAVGKVADNAGSGLATKIASIFSSFADSKIGSFLFKACSAGTTKAALQSALNKVGDKLGKTIIGKAASKALSAVANVVGKFSPLTIAIWVKDFIAGFDQADTLLGVAKGDEYKVGVGQKCLCGLLNLINNQLTFGLIPTETIIDIIVEFLFPLFGLSADELNAARANADNIMDEWNEKHPEETYTNLEDFNNKDKWWFKAKTAIGKKMGEFWGNVKEGASETWNKVKEGASKAWDKTKEFAGNAWNKTKEFGSNVRDKAKELGTNAVNFFKEGFNKVSDKVKDVTEKVSDVGTFIKDIVSNTFKAIKDPEYKWNINDYVSEDDPLFGVKKTIHSVIRIPLMGIGLIARIGKMVSDKIKGIVLEVKEGHLDAKTDVDAVKSGQYTVFSKDYWTSDGKDNDDNPLSKLSTVFGYVSRFVQAPTAMLGWIGTKIKELFVKIIGDAKEGHLDAKTDVDAVKSGQYTVFSKDYWTSDNKDEDNPLSILGNIFGYVSRYIQAPTAMLGWTGTKIKELFVKLTDGAKEGSLDAKSDVDAVKSGRYTIFSREYWSSDRDDDNPLSKLGSVFGFVNRFVQAPMAMLGWTGTKIKELFTKIMNNAKEGSLDATMDVDAVKSGAYTVFSREYWSSDNTDGDNPLSKLGSVFGFVNRFVQAPMAMLGWTGTKIKELFTQIVDGASEGSLDATMDVDAVKSGAYTVFSKDYWTSDENGGDNPLSKLANVFGFVNRIVQAPAAMIGWTGTKIKELFTQIVDGASEGSLDAKSDIDAVKSGEYTVFSKDYWSSSEEDSDNPLSKLGSVFGFVNRFVQAPMAMLGWIGTKVSGTFKTMIDGIKDVQSDTDATIKKVENGTMSVFDDAYWKITVDETNPLNVLGKVVGTIERLIRAPFLVIKSFFTSIKNKVSSWFDLSGIKDLVGGLIGGDDEEEASAEGRRGRGRRYLYGRGHIYQSDSIIANMKYGDSTIGKSGCAPVAATNLINNINPNTMSVQEAAAFAEKNGLTVRGGGTDMSYFNKFLSSKGIATSNTTNKDSVISALENGHQVIMLGKDSNDAPGTPFGSNPHFVTATGIDNYGNIIVQDPDLPQSSVVYKKNNLFKSMISSIITNGNNIKMKNRLGHGLGKKLWGGSASSNYEDTYNYDSSYNTSSMDNSSVTTSTNGLSVNNLLSELGTLGTNTIKYAYGDVFSALYGNSESTSANSGYSDTSNSNSSTSSGSVNLSGNSNGEKIWNFLRSKGYTPAGTAGIMGNLYAESGLLPNNIQNSYEYKYGSDTAYTNAVDSKSRGKEAFSNDSAGYGLAQWTYNTRKRGLYEATVEQGKSIADLSGQLSYLDKELKEYSGLYKTLTSTSSISTASDKMLKEFEKPAVLNYNTRRGYSNSMYNQYSGSGRSTTGDAANALNSYNEYYGTSRPVNATAGSQYIDYSTFLQTIVTILTNISGNTAILGKILEILSKHFEIDMSKAEIEAVAASALSAEQTKAALNDLVQRSGGNSSKVSKLLNNQDTDYIFAAMSAIAQE